MAQLPSCLIKNITYPWQSGLQPQFFGQAAFVGPCLVVDDEVQEDPKLQKILLTVTGRPLLGVDFGTPPEVFDMLLELFSTSTEGIRSSDEEYQFLERSKTPTYHFQPGLMRLPIPKLEDTGRRYLTGIRPFMTENQHAHVSKLVKDFLHNEGPELQAELIAHDKRNPHTSYISAPWSDKYLKDRAAVPLNHNPVMAFAFDPDKPYNDPLTRATNMIISIGRFKRSLDAEVLTPEIFHLNPKNRAFARKKKLPVATGDEREIIMEGLAAGGLGAHPQEKIFLDALLTPRKLSWLVAASLFKAFPLDMSQHSALFNTTRIPLIGRDEIFREPGTKHFVVMRKGHFFTVALFHQDGTLVSPRELHASLSHVMNIPLEAAPHPVGMLSTLGRDSWAEARKDLLSCAPGNEEAMRKVDGALFCLCLDDLVSEEPKTVVRNLLHGDGSNRWFDKSFSLIMHGDGLTAVNFEHAWGDGVAVLRMMEDVHKDSLRNHWVHPNTKPSDGIQVSKFVGKIDFQLSEKMKSRIEEARAGYKRVCDSIEFSTLEYDKMNKDYIKNRKLSPDAVIQLGIQIGYYKQYGKTPCTYESCSTAVYRHGRTETMRPATSDTKRCVQAFLSKEKPPAEQLRKMIEQCSKTHSHLVKEASMGHGFDRHLLGLKVTALRLNKKVPALLSDESYDFAHHYTVSTSTLSTETIILGGFGAVVPDGYGCGYNVTKDKMGMIVSGYPPATNPDDFTECVEEGLEDIFEVLEHSK